MEHVHQRRKGDILLSIIYLLIYNELIVYCIMSINSISQNTSYHQIQHHVYMT